MRLPKTVPIFGDYNFRGKCNFEDDDLMSFMLWLKENHPVHFARCAHVKNEGKRTWGQIQKEKKMGALKKGFPDLFIYGKVNFMIEVKRKDHTKSTISKEQIKYLEDGQSIGSFVGVALGLDGMKEAFNQWLIMTKEK